MIDVNDIAAPNAASLGDGPAVLSAAPSASRIPTDGPVAMTQYETLTNQLNDRLAALKARIHRIDGDLNLPLDADFEEQAVDLEDREAMEAVENAGMLEIQQIRRALARIADGSYGTCARCGAAIAPKRLEVLPTATLCIACAR